MEEKEVSPVEKKVKAKKKIVEANVVALKKKPAAIKSEEQKVVTEKKTVKTATKPIKKKSVAKKKVANKIAKPTVIPVKETKKLKKTLPTVTKKPLAEKELKPKVATTPLKESTGNPMLLPKIEKVTVNMSVGKSGAPLEQAVTIIKQITNQEPSKRQAKKTIREFGIRKGESIACLVTLRGKSAEEFLKKAFYAVDNKLSKYCFDRQGNFSFGIKEHINIPGTKYSPELGIHGMDVSVSLGRAGYRVKRRHRVKCKIGKDHILTPDEAILFIKDEFDVEIM